VAGLAWSIGLAALVNAGWLLVGLYRGGAWVPGPGWTGLLIRVVSGCALLALVLVLGGQNIDWLALQSQPLKRIGLLLVLIAGSGALYLGVLWSLGVRLASLRRAV